MEKERQKQKILEFMKNKEYRPMKSEEIAVIMQVPKDEYKAFFNILLELEQEFKILKTKGDKYKIVKNQYLEGIYRRNQRGFGFVKMLDKNIGETDKTEKSEEIYISKEDSLNAITGDRVLVKPYKFEDNSKSESVSEKVEGKIVKILEHEKYELVGLFK